MTRLSTMLAVTTRAVRDRGARALATLAVVTLLGGCDGGSGQSGSSFVFLTVDGFSTGAVTPNSANSGTINSSVSTGTTTTACVTLRNNQKAPNTRLTTPTALDNILIQSYTLTLTLATGATLAGPLTFGASALIPAGTVAAGTGSAGPNTGTFPVVLVPSNVKGGIAPGTVATALFRFHGRDVRGNAVEADGAVAVVFVAASVTDSSCGTAPAPVAPPPITP